METYIYDSGKSRGTTIDELRSMISNQKFKYIMIGKYLHDKSIFNDVKFSGNQTLPRSAEYSFIYCVSLGDDIERQVYVDVKNIKYKNVIFIFDDINEYRDYLKNENSTVKIFNFNKNQIENIDDKLFLKLVYDNKLMEYIDERYQNTPPPPKKVVSKEKKDVEVKSSSSKWVSGGSYSFDYDTFR